MTENQPMTEAMYYILLALLRPGHGYGMMQRITELSAGRIHMGPGTLYGVLNRMKKEGWIVLESEEERRKTYAITLLGRQALQEEYRRLKRLVEDGRLLDDERLAEDGRLVEESRLLDDERLAGDGRLVKDGKPVEDGKLAEEGER